MNIIQLTEEQKNKLLEMSKKLFSEYKDFLFWDFDSYDDFCGLGGIEKIHDCLCLYPEELPRNITSKQIEWDKPQVGNIPKTFHWFEFCMTYLVNAIYYPDNNTKRNTRSQVEYFFFQSFVDSIEGATSGYNHPIDYLYEEFKKLK